MLVSRLIWICVAAASNGSYSASRELERENEFSHEDSPDYYQLVVKRNENVRKLQRLVRYPFQHMHDIQLRQVSLGWLGTKTA